MSESFSHTPPESDSTSDSPSESASSIELYDDITLAPLDDLLPYANNPKEHPAEQVDEIAASIREYGFDQPIVVDANGTIIKGHGRYQAAKRLGLDRAPVIEQNTTDTQAKASRIVDNKVAESDWASDQLAIEIEQLIDDQPDIELYGFDDSEVDDLLELTGPPEMAVEEFETSDDTDDDGIHPGGDALTVVFHVDSEADAEYIGAWAEDEGFEWHVIDS